MGELYDDDPIPFVPAMPVLLKDLASFHNCNPSRVHNLINVDKIINVRASSTHVARRATSFRLVTPPPPPPLAQMYRKIMDARKGLQLRYKRRKQTGYDGNVCRTLPPLLPPVSHIFVPLVGRLITMSLHYQPWLPIHRA